MKAKLFSYNYEDTLVHRLSGLTKLICFMLLTFAIMFSYDIRVILAYACLFGHYPEGLKDQIGARSS